MKSTPLLLIMVLSLPTAAQDVAGKWISYSTVWKGKERIQNDKWQRSTLNLLKDSTYVKQYYTYKTVPTQFNVQLDATGEGTEVKVKNKANALNQTKKVEKGTYSMRKSIHSVKLLAADSSYHELYTFENGELIRAIPTEGIINSTEKYIYIKFKLKKKF